MEANVNTKVVKIDLETILNNYREPEFWDKQWVIMDTREIRIIWKMTHINVEKGTIKSKLVATRTHIVRDDFSIELRWRIGNDWELPSIPVNRDDYGQEQFEAMLYKGVVHLLDLIETRCVMYYDDYNRAERLLDEEYRMYTREANDKLNEQHVYDEMMRSSYIDKYVDNAMKSRGGSYLIDVLCHYRYHVIPDAYKFAASWFDNSEDLAKYYSMDMSVKGPHSKEVIFNGTNI